MEKLGGFPSPPVRVDSLTTEPDEHKGFSLNPKPQELSRIL